MKPAPPVTRMVIFELRNMRRTGYRSPSLLNEPAMKNYEDSFLPEKLQDG
jgi:hypothetical protein